MDGWWCVLCKYVQSYLSFTICSLCCIGKTLKTFHMALASTGSQTQPQLSVHISHTRVKHTTNTTMNSCRCEEPWAKGRWQHWCEKLPEQSKLVCGPNVSCASMASGRFSFTPLRVYCSWWSGKCSSHSTSHIYLKQGSSHSLSSRRTLLGVFLYICTQLWSHTISLTKWLSLMKSLQSLSVLRASSARSSSFWTAKYHLRLTPALFKHTTSIWW